MTTDTPAARPDADAARILHARAQALARPASRSSTGPGLEILEFFLANERYGLETSYVREVHPLRNLTPLPCTPAFVSGVVNLRGQIVPVLDLKKFFGLAEQGLTDLHRIILVGQGELEFGLLADISVGVRTIAVDSIQPAPSTLEGPGAEYLKGVTAERLVILDLAAILADPRILVNETPDNVN